MDGEKRTATDITIKKGKFATWFDNYWYHYKWVTIVVAFFLVVLLVGFLQMCTKSDYDILVTYAGPSYLDVNDKVELEKALQDSLPEGYSKDEPIAELISYFTPSKEQIEKMEKETGVDSSGKTYQVDIDNGFVTTEMDSFESQLTTGSGSVLFVDAWIYNDFLDSEGNCERLVPIQDVLGENAKGLVGKYGIRLGDTDFYKNNPQLSFLPEDTVICLHAKIIGQKDYEKQIEAFKAFAAVSDTGVN